MEKDQHQTRVVFRKWDGDIIALFPDEAYNTDPRLCTSYLHVGQHGSADPKHIVASSKLATPEEYADLKKELESIGYNLLVLKRCPANSHNIRMYAGTHQ